MPISGLEHRVRWKLERGMLGSLLSPSTTILSVEKVILDRWLGSWHCNKSQIILAYFNFFLLIFALLLISREIVGLRVGCSFWRVYNFRFHQFLCQPSLIQPSHLQPQVA